MSQTTVEVVVFEDASSTSDAGNLITSLRLKPGEPSRTIISEARNIRYKVRSSKAAPWRWLGRNVCANGQTIKVF